MRLVVKSSNQNDLICLEYYPQGALYLQYMCFPLASLTMGHVVPQRLRCACFCAPVACFGMPS